MSAAQPVARSAATRLVGAGVVIIGAVLLAIMFRPLGERGPIESGIAYAIVTYDLALPLVGLGVSMATLKRWQAIFFGLMLIGSVPLGIVGEHRLLSAAGLPPELARHFTYLGPLCCVAAGLALAPARRIRLWILPVAAVLCGATLGFLAALHDPAVGDLQFASGAAAAALWLMAAPTILLRWFDVSWLKIGGPILGSWLVAIGVLLGTSKFVVQQREHAQRQLFVQPPASLDPGANDDVQGLVRPRERSDQYRQP